MGIKEERSEFKFDDFFSGKMFGEIKNSEKTTGEVKKSEELKDIRKIMDIPISGLEEALLAAVVIPLIGSYFKQFYNNISGILEKKEEKIIADPIMWSVFIFYMTIVIYFYSVKDIHGEKTGEKVIDTINLYKKEAKKLIERSYKVESISSDKDTYEEIKKIIDEIFSKI